VRKHHRIISHPPHIYIQIVQHAMIASAASIAAWVSHLLSRRSCRARGGPQCQMMATAAIIAAALVLAMPYSSADEILAGNVGTVSPVSSKLHDSSMHCSLVEITFSFLRCLVMCCYHIKVVKRQSY
jgi:peptidoglycan biosynthesis protein MviN/MurJ (putative lipid II flippase)